MSADTSPREVEVIYFRYTTTTRTRDIVKLGFKSGNSVYGIYWGGSTEGWVPAKWAYPSGDYNFNGKKSDLDISIDDLKKELG